MNASQVRQGEKKRKWYAIGARRQEVKNGALRAPRDSVEKNTTVLPIGLIIEAWGTTKPLSFIKRFWEFISRNALKSKAKSKNRHFLLLGLALVRDQNCKKRDQIHRLKNFFKHF